MNTKKLLGFVKEEQKEIILLGQIVYILGWDQLVNLPKDASRERAEQISLLEANIHKRLISKKLYLAIKRLLNQKGISFEDQLMLKKLFKIILKSKKFPESFVKELSKVQAISQSAWHEAKEKNDFKIFKPHLEKIVKLKQLECKYLNLPGHKYNSLLDFFEEGMTVEILKKEFNVLKLGLIKLIEKIKETKKYKNQKKKLTKKEFQKEHQIDLIHDVIKRIGLTNSSSRLDFSSHPFTTRLGKKDIRITTEIRKDPLFAFKAAIHEAGHGLYELNLPENYLHTFVSEASSYGLHESQSGVWENNIGLSKSFWKFYFKEFKKRFNIKGNIKEWYEEINQVSPTGIRLDSDEVFYCLHIILRFELELDLIEGKIKVSDLPRIWNKKIKDYFDIRVKNDSEGVLQDIHWSSGAIGYFPTYIIGTVYASQLFLQMKKEIPGFDAEVEKGNFSKISNWLDKKIHKKGSTKSAEEIIKDVCGEGLNVQVFLDYLNKKYSKIYKFKKENGKSVVEV